MPSTEFSRRVKVEPWPANGIAVEVTANPDERRALARRFGVIEVTSLRGHGRLERVPGEVRFDGWLDAEVVQSCVVTLEPVPASLHEAVERRYRLGDLVPDEAAAPWGDPDDDEEVETVSEGEIDIGEAIAEALGLALDPYPRASDADLTSLPELGPDVTLTTEAPPDHRFAALRQLKDKLAR